MSGRPSQKSRSRADEAEINLIPMMNLLCILIPFLLLSAAFVQLTMIETSLPARARAVATDEPIPEPEEKLTLTVLILEDGMTLAGAGGILAVGGEGEQAQNVMIGKKRQILMRTDGLELRDETGQPIWGDDYDWDTFKANLIKVKLGYLNQYSIILMPEDTISYETIIKVMDTARYYKPEGKDEEEFLFPNATLAKGIVVGSVQ
ncbi:MAG: biopolymer transporter ExbD [Candidatus Alcyoniella australis]|nr:biopolymer transporter ExbD [Candidatus Alcyoniella australis]